MISEICSNALQRIIPTKPSHTVLDTFNIEDHHDGAGWRDLVQEGRDTTIPLRAGGSYRAFGRGLRVTLLKGWHSQVAKSLLK